MKRDREIALEEHLHTLTARCLSGSDLKVLGGDADGTPDLQVLCLGSSNKVSAHL
jgi:hypothetical protein